MSGKVSQAVIISRRNIACVASLLIETVCNLPRPQLDESCGEVTDLLCVLHHVFFHGFKYKWSKLTKSVHPWRFIATYSSQDRSGCIELVHLLEDLHDDSAKLLAWIKTLLLKRCIIYGFDFVRCTCSALKNYYYPGALLFSDDFDRIMVLARHLGRIDFNLDLRDRHMNSEVLRPINYAAYLHRCSTKCTDDRDGPRELPVSISPSYSPFLELRNTYFTLLKDYGALEDKLALQASRLKRYEAELSKLRRLRQELESQILELQIQVTLYHEECTKKLLAAGLNWSVHRPPTTTLWESIRQRRQRLVAVAEQASDRPVQNSPVIQAHPSEYTLPSLSVVDQGVDALLLDACAQQQNSSSDSSFHHRRLSMHVVPCHRHLASETDQTSGEFVPKLTGEQTSLERSWTSLYVTPSFVSDETLLSKGRSTGCFSLQKMPRSNEYYFLSDASASQSSFCRKSLCG
ncbi:unnamed protein product [Dicrocoelium dendriticum]|nr:unnamed protein product [Dicrocoelium dendriticum]